MKILKSIGAVFAGFLTVVVLSTGTDAILESAGFLPPPDKAADYAWWMLFIALIYRMIFTVAGGYVAARLAPDKQMRHVFILAWIGLAAGIAGIVVGWSYGNHWYPIGIAVTSFPCVWYGGMLKNESVQ